MDFIIGLPKSEGKTFLMVIVDRLTKYAHFFSLYHPFKEITIIISFMEIVQKLHGVTKINVSDRDPIFTRKFWTKLFLVWILNWLIAHLTTLNPMEKLGL